jgi:hypothetical protein
MNRHADRAFDGRTDRAKEENGRQMDGGQDILHCNIFGVAVSGGNTSADNKHGFTGP